MLEYNLPELQQRIRDTSAKVVAFQFPEGLKTVATKIVSNIEHMLGVQGIVIADPCYGACDIADDHARKLGAELLVHFGHAEMVNSSIETIYVPLEYRLNRSKAKLAVKKLVKKMEKKGFSKLGLCCTIQYIQYLPEVKLLLEKELYKIFVDKGHDLSNPGQVLGCNFNAVKEYANKVDAVVFVGDGLFHPLGVSYVVGKPVYALDVRDGSVVGMDKERDKFLRKRSGMIAKAKRAEKFLIAVSTKKGQMRIALAKRLEKLLASKGRKGIIVAVDFVRPEYFLGLEYDCIISTACPRIATDEYMHFNKPIITPFELEVMFDEKSLFAYSMDELQI